MSDLAHYAQALFGLSLTAQQLDQFQHYQTELLAWNEQMNLTAITDPQQVMVRHFLDSLSVTQVIGFDEGDGLVDVGTGAGFPGLPLAIAFPKLRVTLMDGTAKKLKFLDHVLNALGLTNVGLVHARAEEAARLPLHRAAYDVVVARAVARMPTLAEYLLPLAKIGGYCVALKGQTAATEMEDARRAVFVLGGSFKPSLALELPGLDEAHVLVTIEKLRKTPDEYPRAQGLPSKKPIGSRDKA